MSHLIAFIFTCLEKNGLLVVISAIVWVCLRLEDTQFDGHQMVKRMAFQSMNVFFISMSPLVNQELDNLQGQTGTYRDYVSFLTESF